MPFSCIFNIPAEIVLVYGESEKGTIILGIYYLLGVAYKNQDVMS